MNEAAVANRPIDSGTIPFTIESRIVRELGERLVKEPHVALLELIKNSFDADATVCTVTHSYPKLVVVEDDGHGMTVNEFKTGWMRVGTSAKEERSTSRRYSRNIVGEKGIGRFAVRYLGTQLRLSTVAFDEQRRYKTRLEAEFNWPDFDRNEDLGKIQIPWKLFRESEVVPTGTSLSISELRDTAREIDFRALRNAAISVVSPYHALLGAKFRAETGEASDNRSQDPGFRLQIEAENVESEQADLATIVLDAFVLRAVLNVHGDRLRLNIFRRRERIPHIRINDRFPNSLGSAYADIRFYPRRAGVFTGLPVDGRLAQGWVRAHSGIAVFDRTFRVFPYGMPTDDWLSLSADQSRSVREPKSTLAIRHFQMTKEQMGSTALNYMLRLPYPYQLVGAVQVSGRRTKETGNGERGLIATADREGFLANETFRELWDVVRGATEAIAYADRELQLEEEEAERKLVETRLKKETREAIKDIQANKNLSSRDRLRIVKRLAAAESAAARFTELEGRREANLEVMSLLGVVAGFMTHEFGVALDQLERARDRIEKLGKTHAPLAAEAEKITASIEQLKEFAAYTQGYVSSATKVPDESYPARPRIKQVTRVFGKYATDRGIEVDIDVDSELVAPRVPVALYNGIALNLFTNALKAITAKVGDGTRKIAFRAWNEGRMHYLEVSDTGVGIPETLHERVFDPLFTTTEGNRDPLGSGMGLGLPLIRRGLQGFGGRIDVTNPPPGFSTCFRVRIPMGEHK